MRQVMGPDVGVTTGVCTLWQQEELLDFTIEVQDEKFRVHKLIMASVSGYFKALVTGGEKERQTEGVRLEGLDPLAVSNMIDFIYTGQFGTKTAATEVLLVCAVYFKFPAAISKCAELLCQDMNEHNCFDILRVFKAFSIEDSVERTMKFIKSNSDNILKVCKPNELSCDKFLVLMDIWGKSEWELFDSANLWISVDFESRVQHLNDLMSHIRFALMTPKELAGVKESFTFTTFKGSWCDLVQKAIQYHTLPTYQKILYDSNQSTVREDQSPVCFHDSSAGFYTADKKGAWTHQSALSTPDGGITAVLEVNNYLIVCDTFHTYQEWSIFDPRTKQWSLMASMKINRKDFALVYHEEHLYVLGGRWYALDTSACHLFDDRIERYSFLTNTWTAVKGRMPHATYGHSACSLNGSIYVTEGMHRLASSNIAVASTRFDAFNPASQTWTSKAPLMVKPSYCKVQVVRLWDEEVILVVGEYLMMQYYTPSTDRWSHWEWNESLKTEDQMIWKDESTLLARGNHLYFLNFHRDVLDGYNSGSDYECYEPCYSEYDGACTEWLVEEKGKKITEVTLEQLPANINKDFPQKKLFCALLSFAP